MSYINHNAYDIKGVDVLVAHRNHFMLGGKPFQYGVSGTVTFARSRWLVYQDEPNTPDNQRVLQYALAQYTNADENDVPESVIEAFVEKIVAKKDGFDWYLRFDGDPNDPLHLKTEGRRRTNSTVSTVGGHVPTTPFCDSGSYC